MPFAYFLNFQDSDSHRSQLSSDDIDIDEILVSLENMPESPPPLQNIPDLSRAPSPGKIPESGDVFQPEEHPEPRALISQCSQQILESEKTSLQITHSLLPSQDSLQAEENLSQSGLIPTKGRKQKNKPSVRSKKRPQTLKPQEESSDLSHSGTSVPPPLITRRRSVSCEQVVVVAPRQLEMAGGGDPILISSLSAAASVKPCWIRLSRTEVAEYLSDGGGQQNSVNKGRIISSVFGPKRAKVRPGVRSEGGKGKVPGEVWVLNAPPQSGGGTRQQSGICQQEMIYPGMIYLYAFSYFKIIN